MPRLTMLYDGQCNFCRGQAATVRNYDAQGVIELLDLHDPTAAVRFPQIDAAAARRELHLVAADGRVFSGADAVREILLRLPSLRGLGELMALPGLAAPARLVYAAVAANRYLFGSRSAAPACEDDRCAR